MLLNMFLNYFEVDLRLYRLYLKILYDMKAPLNKRDYDLREKIVCLLLSNPLHKPSCLQVRTASNPPYVATLNSTTVGLANSLIHYIETGEYPEGSSDDIIFRV